MASEKQINYIKSLASQKDLTTLEPQYKAALLTDVYLQTLSNRQVSELLDVLKLLPRATSAEGSATEQTELQQAEEAVEAARYFIVDPTDNTEKFIHVDKPKAPSRWAGYTFVSIRASDDLYRVKSASHRLALLQAIAKDPIHAMNEYGIRLEVCGMCGRTLTQKDSRLRGLGPICAAKVLGKPTDDELNLLSEMGLI